MALKYTFFVILVFSFIYQQLCEPYSNQLEKKNLFDMDGIFNNLYPNINQGINAGSGNSDAPPNSGNQVNRPQYPGNGVNSGMYPDSRQAQVNIPQGNVWNNPNANPGINYPNNNAQLYPGQYFMGQSPRYPGYSDAMQGNRPQFQGNEINSGIYPDNRPAQGNNQQYPGNFLSNNLGGYPGNQNILQGNQQYPGNGISNSNPNYNYPGNPNYIQGNNPQYSSQGNGLDHINRGPGINYPLNPSDSNQGNHIQFPAMNNNNWNNNRSPGNYQSRPNYNAQNQYPGTNWNNANGLQNNQNPNEIGAGNQLTQGIDRNPAIQGQPPQYPGVYQNYNPGLQSGFPTQISNGLNNQFNSNLQNPNMQYPQSPGAVTTEKVTILGIPSEATPT